LPEWVKVAEASGFPAGRPVQVEVDGEPLCLARIDDDFLATTDICSHAYVELSDGELLGDEIECPLHGSKFSMRTGEVRNPPATQPIDIYDVKVEGDHVLVWSEPRKGSAGN